MKKMSFELGLSLTDDKRLVAKKYDELREAKLGEFKDCANSYLDFRFGQFYLVVVFIWSV